MFSYYGSKSKIVDLYPSPKFGKIIEPFAGSARYALKYFDRDVLLVDKYDVIVKIWHYLQQASEKDILGLPKLKHGDKVSNYKSLSICEAYFLGFLVTGGVESPRDNVASFDGVNVEKDLRLISKQLHKIKHWKIQLGSYEEIPNQEATWFIDPPYQFGGEAYKKNNKGWDYKNLSAWCGSRQGHVIVCENMKADWLPFYPMTEMRGSQHKTTEAIWSNYPHDFQARQASLFEEA